MASRFCLKDKVQSLTWFRCAAACPRTCPSRRAPLSSPLQRRPHLAVALGRPDDRVIDPARLVVGAADVKWQTVLVDSVAAELGVHGFAHLVESLLEGEALVNGRRGRAEQ